VFSVNIYVGNLSYTITDAELRSEFEGYGRVSKVSIITDRETGRPRGFAFVEMDDDNEGRAAIEGLNGKNIGGRDITVNEARPREDRRPRGGGGGGGGGERRGGGGGRDRRW
jgi:cold-inducible RNA-binding protein